MVLRRLVFTVLFLLSLMLSLSSGFLPMSALAIVIGVSFIVSYVWNKLSLKGLSVRIERTPNMGHVGQEVDRLFWIENHSFLSIKKHKTISWLVHLIYGYILSTRRAAIFSELTCGGGM